MAAWSATDDFEADSVGNLNGQGGGTGWSANWSADAGYTVVSSPTFAGSRAAKVNSVTGGDATRTLTTGVDSGIVRVYFYATNVPTGAKGFFPMVLQESTSNRCYIGWGYNNAMGNTVAIEGTTTVTLGTGLAAATWHYVDVEIDGANERFRASLNGGAWSSYVTAIGGSFSTITRFRMTNADGNVSDQGYYYDNIGVGTGPVSGPTTVKTWDGITQSTGIKEYFGVALANVKTVDGAT